VARLDHDGLGYIQRAPAAQAHHAVARGGAVKFGGRQHIVFGGIAVNISEDRVLDAGFAQHGAYRGKGRGGFDAGIRHYQGLVDAGLPEALRQAPHGAAAEQNPGGKRKDAQFLEQGQFTFPPHLAAARGNTIL
jgi:hypothetical protein